MKWMLAKWFAFTALGPVAAAPSFFMGIVSGLWKLIKGFFKGVGIILAEPLAMLATAVLCLSVGVAAFKWGMKYDAHLVAVANQSVATLEAKLKAAEDIDDAKAKAAIAAREAAKMPFITGSLPEPTKAGSGVPAAKPRVKRVRKPTGDDKACGRDFPASVLCF